MDARRAVATTVLRLNAPDVGEQIPVRCRPGNRGGEGLLLIVVDGLKGFPEAILAVFPQATVQTCIVHRLRYRKRVAEIFGWLKTVGGQRQTRIRGLARVSMAWTLTLSNDNLVRVPKLVAAAA